MTRVKIFNADGTEHEVQLLALDTCPYDCLFKLISRHRREGQEFQYGWDVPGEPRDPFSADEMLFRALLKKEFESSAEN